MYQLLKIMYHNFLDENKGLPADTFDKFIDRLDAGLLLVLAGRVTASDTGSGWKVAGVTSKDGKQELYSVWINDHNEWRCNCKDHQHQAPYLPDLYGYSTKACKHITAAALVHSTNFGTVEKPDNIWELVERLVLAQHIPAPGEAWVLPGTPVKIAQKEQDGRAVVVLQTGHSRSKPVIKWRTNMAANPSQRTGEWALTSDCLKNYTEWVEQFKQ